MLAGFPHRLSRATGLCPLLMLLGCCALLAACEQRPPAQVLVWVRADVTSEQQLEQVVVRSSQGSRRFGVRSPLSFPLRTLFDIPDPGAPFEVSVEGTGAAGTSYTVSHRVQIQGQPGGLVLYEVGLTDFCARTARCGDACNTCSCGDDVVEAELLDMSRLASLSGPTTCQTTAVCQDGVCESCDQLDCRNGGECRQNTAGAFCDCPDGFGGLQCEEDYCALRPCGNGGTCEPVQDGRLCDCTAAWTGTDCLENNDPFLVNIVPSHGTLVPAFDTSINDYVLDLGISGSAVTLAAFARTPQGVTITQDGIESAHGLPGPRLYTPVNDERTVRLTVTAESSSSAVYDVTIRRTLTQPVYLKSQDIQQSAQFGGGSADGFAGDALALEGNRLLVGSPYFDLPPPADLADHGRVEFFRRRGGVWGQESLDGPLAEPGSQLGHAVEIDAGRGFASAPLAAAPGEGGADVEQAGAVYAFSEDGSGKMIVRQTLFSPSPESGARFGERLRAEGDTLAVSAARRSTSGAAAAGVVHLFGYEADSESWVFRQTLGAPQPQASGGFGAALALMGDWLFVGAPWTTSPTEGPGSAGAPFSGVVHVFKRGMQGLFEFHQRLTSSSDAQAFGHGLDAGGQRLAVSSVTFGSMDGGTVGDGSTRVYTLVDNQWVDDSVVTLDVFPEVSGSVFPDALSEHVRFDGERLLLVASGESHAASGLNPEAVAPFDRADRSGAAFLFVERDGEWILDAYLKSSAPGQDDGFGTSVALSTDTIVIAAPREGSGDRAAPGDNSSQRSGAAYIYQLDCTDVLDRASLDGC